MRSVVPVALIPSLGRPGGARLRRRRRPLVGAALAVLALGACSRGPGRPGADGTTPTVRAGGCGTDVLEPLDPRSTQHLLPGAPEPTYADDPPTSGPHLVGTSPQGVLDQPLAGPVQVALLEQGDVLVQHRGLAPGDRERIASLATEMVVVAPLAGSGPPVVATAWRHRLACTAVDLPALRAFIVAHRGNALP